MLREKIQQSMKSANWSQIQLARAAGVPLSSLSRYLGGESISADHIDAVLQTLGLAVTGRPRRGPTSGKAGRPKKAV